MQDVLLNKILGEEQGAALLTNKAMVQVEAHALEQEKSRRLFQQQRHVATKMRTKEALQERQDKSDRKKERRIKEQQAREEQRLLIRAEEEASRRMYHERQAVREFMTSKIERVIRRRARYGDDIVDLRGRGFKELPYDLYHGRDALASLSSLLILDLAHNQLKNLPGAIFSSLFALQSLDVSDNELSTLPDEIGQARDLQLLDARSNRLIATPSRLSNLHELRVLHLAYNRLVSFGSNCSGLQFLEELNLAGNALEFLADEMGDALVNLVRLTLRGNSTLKRLPNSLQRLRHLREWDLGVCNQKRLSTDVFGAQLVNLRSVNLSFNALSTLPDGVGAMPKLQELNLKSNSLVSLPPTVGHLVELVDLNAENNALQWLPPDCGEHWNLLEVLRLSHNQLASLPITLGLLHSLRTLHLSNNRLVALPLEIGALVNLRELDMSWNQLTCIPDEFGCLESLTILDLSHNQLRTLPGTIAMLQRLVCFRCSCNALTTPLEPGFGLLKCLRYADLAQNQLVELEPCLYELPKLEVLNLYSNKIAMLPHEMSKYCTALRKLDLYNNRLQALPLELADKIFAQLEVLSIERNPLTLFTEKTSSTWNLKDQYQTSFANGYTPAEAKAWIADRSVCYPVFVQVWEELMANKLASQSLPMIDRNSRDSVDISNPRISSDVFCERVKAVMNTTVSENSEVPRVWQPRYERLARHYFYEFKHVGHTIVFDASTQQVSGKQNAEIEVQLQRQRMDRASAAIKECNEFRAQLESAYRVDKDLLVSAMEHVHERRLRHESNLLEQSRRANLAISASIKDLVDVAQRRHEEAKRLQRAQFADEMKCLARERQRVKQQRVLIEKLRLPQQRSVEIAALLNTNNEISTRKSC